MKKMQIAISTFLLSLLVSLTIGFAIGYLVFTPKTTNIYVYKLTYTCYSKEDIIGNPTIFQLLYVRDLIQEKATQLGFKDTQIYIKDEHDLQVSIPVKGMNENFIKIEKLDQFIMEGDWSLTIKGGLKDLWW